MQKTISAICDVFKEAFPEMQGRAFVVSEIDDLTKDTIPTLPLIVAALIKENNLSDTVNGIIEIEEDFVVEFWWPTNRYCRADGTETPFWAAFDHDALRDKVLSITQDWISPRGGRIRYIDLQVDSTPFAAMTAFRFKHKFVWCDMSAEYTVIKKIGSTVSIDSGSQCQSPLNCEQVEECP